MKTIAKDQLIDGAYYEGFDEDEYPYIARWDGYLQMFFANIHSWEETYAMPMSYEGEETEYYGEFSPVAFAQPREEDIVAEEELYIDDQEGEDAV